MSEFSPEQERVVRRLESLWALVEHPGTPEHERDAARRMIAKLEQRHGLVRVTEPPPPEMPPEPPVRLVVMVNFSGGWHNGISTTNSTMTASWGWPL